MGIFEYEKPTVKERVMLIEHSRNMIEEILNNFIAEVEKTGAVKVDISRNKDQDNRAEMRLRIDVKKLP